MSYPRNNASPERIAVGAVVQISDGAVQTSGVSISVRGQGGASGVGAGTTAYDNGIVQYTPTQGETDFTSFVVVAYKTGCIPASVTVVTSANGTPGVVVVPSTQKVDVDTIKTQSVTCAAGVTVSPYVGSTGAAINGTNANTLSGHDPGATLGTSTLTQAQVTGGAYALNHASFAFNAALDFTTTQKAATLARVTLVDTTTNVTNTPTFNGPSAATIADAVLDEALSGHLTLGSFGYYVAEIHATGDLSYLIVSDGTNGNAAIKTYLTTNVGLSGANLTDIPDPLVTNSGTAQAGASGTITLATSASTTADFYKDQAIVLTGGTGAGQTNRITAYSTGRVATVQTTWVTTPDNTTTYKVLGRVE